MHSLHKQDVRMDNDGSEVISSIVLVLHWPVETRFASKEISWRTMLGRICIVNLLAVLLCATVIVPTTVSFRLTGQVVRNCVDYQISCFHGQLKEMKQAKMSGYKVDDGIRTRMYSMDLAFQKHKKIPLPFMEETVGIVGRWREVIGNFILEPPEGIKPIATVHFLGDAFVGAAPHLSYRYLLELLAERGLIIVATPYRLDLDYLRICDGIISKFRNASAYLKDIHGPLPIIGMGHSGGALLHTLLSSLFPNDIKDLNVLISFNNRPAAHAIPAFHELVIPLSKRIMSEQFLSKNLRRAANFMRRYFDMAVDLYSESILSPTFISDEILPLMKHGFELIDQVPPLLKVIANGQEEFSPSPSHIQEVIKMMYRAKKTLLIQFESDRLDGTMELEKLLKESNTIMRMKLLRSLDKMEVERRVFNGTHITPLIQNLLLEVNPSGGIPVPESYHNLRQKFQVNFMKTVTDLSNEIATFVLHHYGGNDSFGTNKQGKTNSSTVPSVEPSIRVPSQKQSSGKTLQENNSFSHKYENVVENNAKVIKENEAIDFHSETARRRAALFLDERLKFEQALREERRPINLLKTTTKAAISSLKNTSVSLFHHTVASLALMKDIAMKNAVFIWISVLSTSIAMWAALYKVTKETMQQAKLLSQKVIINVNTVVNKEVAFGRNLPNDLSMFLASILSMTNIFLAQLNMGFMKGIRVVTALATEIFNIAKFFTIFIFRSIWVGVVHVTQSAMDTTGGMMQAMVGSSMANSIQVSGENIQYGLQSMVSGAVYGVSRLLSHMFNGMQTMMTGIETIPHVLSNTIACGGSNIATESKYLWSRGTFPITMFVGQLVQSTQSLLSNPINSLRQAVVQHLSSIRPQDVYNTSLTLLQQFIVALYIYFLPSS